MGEAAGARTGERFHEFAAQHIAGPVFTSGSLPERCSTDMSIFRSTPAAVVRPSDESDIAATLAFARSEMVPVTARAGGSNTGGAALTSGIVLLFDGNEAWSRLKYDPDTGEVTAGPAVRHDELQALLRRNGRMLPSDPSSGPLSRIGGNIATKASGPHALKHGAIDRYLEALRVITGDGRTIATDRQPELPARIRDGVEKIRRQALEDDEVLELLRRRRDMKIASGYNLFALLEEDADLRLARLFAGSVGTLGIVTEARLRTVAAEEGRTTVEVFFESAHAAVGAASRAVELGAAACEFLNRECIRTVRAAHPELAIPEAGSLLLLEFTGEGHHDAAAELAHELGTHSSPAPRVSSDPDVQARLWEVRKRLLFIVKNPGPGREALSVVNDVGVPQERLPELVNFAEELFARHGLTAPIYGHAGSGNLHMRPVFDLRAPDVIKTVEEVAAEIYGEVTRLGGTVTAEHGMGPLRAPYLELEWPAGALSLMRDLKALFDPDGILNPGALFPAAHPPPYRFIG